MISKKDLGDILKPALIGAVGVFIATGSLMSWRTKTINPLEWRENYHIRAEESNRAYFDSIYGDTIQADSACTGRYASEESDRRILCI